MLLYDKLVCLYNLYLSLSVLPLWVRLQVLSWTKVQMSVKQFIVSK